MDRPINLKQQLKAWFGAKALNQFSFLLWYALALMILSLFSCTSPLMTRSAYEGIPIGAPIAEVEAQVGPAYEVIAGNQPDISYYRYIERIEIGPGSINQNTYTLTIVDGKVADKRLSHCSKGVLDVSSP